MNHAGFLGWTTTSHEYWHAPKKDSWDETPLSVAGFTTLGESHEGDKQKIQFKDFANSVRRLPQGDEALDVTRMVQYCVKHPVEPWTYPQDHDRLLRLTDGPIAVSRGNLDRVLFRAWEDTQPPPHRLWSIAEQETAKALLKTKKEKRIDNKLK
jgi:hypothetical protein